MGTIVPLMSCQARLPVYAVVVGALFAASPAWVPTVVVLSMLARVGGDDDDAARAAFAKAAVEVELPADGMLGAESCTLRALDESLSALDRALPLVKRRIIGACAACVLC